MPGVAAFCCPARSMQQSLPRVRLRAAQELVALLSLGRSCWDKNPQILLRHWCCRRCTGGQACEQVHLSTFCRALHQGSNASPSSVQT